MLASAVSDARISKRQNSQTGRKKFGSKQLKFDGTETSLSLSMHDQAVSHRINHRQPVQAAEVQASNNVYALLFGGLNAAQPQQSAFAMFLQWVFLWPLLHETSFRVVFAVQDAWMQTIVPRSHSLLLAPVALGAAVTGPSYLLAKALFLPHVYADLSHFVDTDFLSFSASRAIENLTPFIGPPLHDAVCMEFMITRGLATRIQCSNLDQTNWTNASRFRETDRKVTLNLKNADNLLATGFLKAGSVVLGGCCVDSKEACASEGTITTRGTGEQRVNDASLHNVL
eukprot:CAMPEP_0172788344 /NCGR_PEP_ID=MMETSP1074-20121228/206905_1 /TAXON_ID=2916 /ORGANISM="Ceratium fusus, Strain PA161109" /LENGTH=284 /DNA_ID=CAMNT_0013625369 /DNA_START=585 /DNA_END=1437 /DNA_ORIENTATION=+